MSDSGSGAGGVGSDGGSNSASGSSASDSLGGLAESVSESLSEAVSAALGTVSDALGIGEALGQIADALGLDTQDLQGLIGAAVLGAISGGLSGAMAAVAQGVIGGTLAEAAHDAVNAHAPESMQAVMHQAIDAMMVNTPGAMASTNPQSVIGALTSGAFTNGRAPSIDAIGDVARSISSLTDAAQGAFNAIASGNYAGAVEAASAFDGLLGSQFEQAREVVSQVALAYDAGHGVYASGGRDALGNAMEQVAVATVRMMGDR